MKKILFVCSLLIGCVSADAQFVIYNSTPDVPQSSYAPSSRLGGASAIFNYEPSYPVPRYQMPARPKMQEVTLRGYYKKGNDWYNIPIKVGVAGDEVKLLSIKTQGGWMGCGSAASEVGAFDTEEIRDNFNYKAYSTLYGTVYF